jgi:hypothetical protein
MICARMSVCGAVIASSYPRCIIDGNPLMEMQPHHHEARTSSARSAAAQVRVEVKAMERTKRREISAEEFELIEMRYQQALAVWQLEELFAEGQLNCF